MPDLTILKVAVADVSRQIRVRRAEFYGLRGLFGGAVAALLPLVLRDSLGWSGFLWAGACLALGAAIGCGDRHDGAGMVGIRLGPRCLDERVRAARVELVTIAKLGIV